MIQSNILLTDVIIPTVDNLIVNDVPNEEIVKDSDIIATNLTVSSLEAELIQHVDSQTSMLLDVGSTEFNILSTEIVVGPAPSNHGMLLNPEIPVYDNAVPTDISLNTNSQSNSDILDIYESVDAIPGTTPGSGSLFPEDPTQLPQINSLFELLQYLSEVMMRFNSSPDYYMQDDFAVLVKTITNALIHLYLTAPLSTGEVEGLYAALGTKVDKILGKGLSTNDLTNELKAAYDAALLETHTHANKSALDLVSGENTGDQDLSGLQPKETGKGLSTNDYTTTEKNKLAGIQANAEVNVNADWNAISGDAQILNKPTLVGFATETYVQNYAEPKKGSNDNYVTDAEKANLHAPHSDDQDLTPYETIANNNIKLAGKEPANANIQAHIANTLNPHFTTKSQIGLSQVDNTSDLNKPISILTQLALNAKEPIITGGLTSEYWRGDKTFQTLDKNAVGLDQVDNTSDINKPISTATQTALDNKEDLITAGLITDYWRGDKTFQPLNKSAVGLDNVDNTSDLLKPISTATQSALDLKLDISLKGANNGLAELDSNGFVKNTQLPSYVDDVLEFTSISVFPVVGESGKIYIDTTTNLTYRWGGTTYAIISSSLALGETSATAYRGDRGKIAYDHSQINSGNPHGLTLLDIGAQAQLNGTGLVRMSGTSVTYDNTSYVSGTPWTSVGYWYSGSHPTTTSGYGLPDYPTTLPASDVYSWAKASTKPSYVWTEIGSRPTNLSQFTNDLGNYGGFVTGTPWTSVGYWYSGNHPTTLSGYGITDTPWGNYLPLTGGTLSGNLNSSNYGKFNSGLFKGDYFMSSPNGGISVTNADTSTGAITITLPAGIGTTMCSMWIDVYLYTTNASFSVHVGGYTYIDNSWSNNPFALVYGADHTVRLGHNGTSFVIYIGETSSSWSYSQVSVRDVLLGYNPNLTNWKNAIGISYSTTLLNVTATISHKVWTTKNLDLSSYATHRPEGTNYIDYARLVYNDGAYSGIGWTEPSNLGVRYAQNSGTASTVRQDFTGTNVGDLLYSSMADNDMFRLRVGGTATNAGYVEIATADDGTEPIYVRQYTGVFSNLVRTLTLLDESGNTSIPGHIYGGGNLYLNQNYGRTIVGAYDASRLQGVFAMGQAYMLPADGSNSGNLYGMAWSHPNAGGQAANLSSHGLLLMQNGVTMAALSTNIWISGTYYGNGGGLTGTASGLSVNYATTSGKANSLVLQSIGSPDQTGLTGMYYCLGGSTPAPSGSNDGTLIMSSYVNSPDQWGSQIYQDYRAGYLYVRGRNNYSWSSWLRVIDSNTIGSQSVSNAVYLTGPAHTNGGDGWWRSDGNCGWYNQTYAVGIFATDSTYVRTYNTCGFKVESTIQSSFDNTDGALIVYGGICAKKDVQCLSLFSKTDIFCDTDVNIGGTFNGNGSGLTNVPDAVWSRYLRGAYVGGQQLNPQVYFNNGIGLKVAMTAFPQVWADTLWINGYEGGDVPNMCALHFLRNGQPRMYITTQASTATSYGSAYEVITAYNIADQKADGALKLWAESHSTSYYLRNNWDGTYWQLTSNHPAAVNVGRADNAGTSNQVTINYSNDSNSTYQMLWGSGNSVYGTSGIYCNPATDVIYAYTFQLTSDIRSKQNINLIEYKPIDVEFKEYEFINNPGKKHYGVIAQEVLVNNPELVEEVNGRLSVNYIDLIMLELANLRKEIKLLKDKYECS